MLTQARPSTAELIQRARALRDTLREDQAAAEERGSHPAETHQRFLNDGFYQILVPERFGGFGYGLETFFQVGIEIARGDPGVAWNYILGAGHTFHLVSLFPEAVQEELLGGGKAFIAPMRHSPPRPAARVADGYLLDATWDYCSGSTYSTHAIVGIAVPQENGPPQTKLAIVPREDFEILPDWGGDRTLGMRASGSNSIAVRGVVVPERLTLDYVYRDPDLAPGDAGTAGWQIHRDPTFLGRTLAYFNAELVATQVGCALAAADEYEHLMRTKNMTFPPRSSRLDSPDYLRWFGEIRAKGLAAESILMDALRRHRELGEMWHEQDRPIQSMDDVDLRARILEAAQLALRAVDIAFASAGTSSVAKGSRMQKYYRDAAMYRTHIAAQFDAVAATSAAHYYGNPLVF